MLHTNLLRPVVGSAEYRTPQALRSGDSGLKRILLIASCLMTHLNSHVYNNHGVHVDWLLFNNAAKLPEKSAGEISAYDFQFVSIPLRAVIPDFLFARNGGEPVDYQTALETAKANLEVLLEASLEYHSTFGILTFVGNFFVPQQNTLGRLLPRRDLKNKAYFISLLNEHLEDLVNAKKNAYIVDVDGIAATLGKRFIQDEVMWADNHGSYACDVEKDMDAVRIERPALPSSIYGFEDVPETFLSVLWSELEASYRTSRGIGAVKMVIFDLDDTLWRGVAAEVEGFSGAEMEGWPLGIIDAINTLRARGIVLAIASKNSEENVRRVWDQLIGPRLSLNDFAITKINWNPKEQNIGEIIREANVLPDSVVFVDDNPVERNAAATVYPAIRVIGSSLYEIKRVLMWSPETQVANVTDESTRRNEMIAQQVVREADRKTMSREEFIASLNVQASLTRIDSVEHAKFPRALELINKTNQFNTSPKRWTFEEMSGGIADGKSLIAVEVKDKYSDYGLVAVAVIDRHNVDQVVMSCRVFGLGIEATLAKEIEEHISRAGFSHCSGDLVQTEKNGPCQTFFKEAGYIWNGVRWEKSLSRTPPSKRLMEFVKGRLFS